MLYWDAYYGEIAMEHEARHAPPQRVPDEIDQGRGHFILVWSAAVLILMTSVAAFIHWLS
jgi:hypothetical protein